MNDAKLVLHVDAGIGAPKSWSRGLSPAVTALNWRFFDPVGSRLIAGRVARLEKFQPI